MSSNRYASLTGQLKRLGRTLSKATDTAKTLLCQTVGEGQLDGTVAAIGQEIESLRLLTARFDDLLDQISSLDSGVDREQDDEDPMNEYYDISIAAVNWRGRLSAYADRLRSKLAHGRSIAALQAQVDQLLQGNQSGVAAVTAQATEIIGSVGAGASNAFTHVKLPKLELQKFGGDVLAWKEFWDSFEACVHQNNRLTDVEKLSYLSAQLEGDAKASIAGLDITNASYQVAVSLLKERFGNTSVLITALHTRLMKVVTAKNDVCSLRRLYNDLECIFRSLVATGQDTDNHHFVAVITSKLPKNVLLALERSKSPSVDWSADLLRVNLNAEICAREAVERLQPCSNNVSGEDKWPQRQNQQRWGNASGKPTSEALVATERQRQITKRCIFCKSNNHWSDECDVVCTAQERKQKLKDRCYVCLSDRHRVKECKSRKECPYCHKVGSHHRSLCYAKFGATNQNESAHVAADKDKNDDCQGTASTEGGMLASTERVLLQTALTRVKKTGFNNDQEVRVLLDCASNRTYITEHLAKQLMLDLKPGQTVHLNRFASEKTKEVTTKLAQLEVLLKDGGTLKLWVSVVPHITGNISRARVDLRDKEFILSGLNLADELPTEGKRNQIELLIGNDYYLDIVTGERMLLKEGLYLLGSRLGWLLTGRTGHAISDETKGTTLLSFDGYDNKELLSTLEQKTSNLERLWELESIGIRDPVSDEGARAMQLDRDLKVKFAETVQFDEGRYWVQWPWKDEIYKGLPDNFKLAYGRLKALLPRLGKVDGLLQKYDDIVQDQLQEAVIEKVWDSTGCALGKLHYIPHHVVINTERVTTKLRVVYNASAKSKKSNLSLNECVHKGHNYLQDLCELLIRFRLQKFAINSDIEKAFLQVGLQASERDCVRFSWLKDPKVPQVEANLQMYRFCRVPFGGISSPYLLGATIEYHLEPCDSKLAKEILDNIYMDNIFLGTNNADDCKDIYIEAKKIFKNAGMNLRSWSSNQQGFADSLPKEDKDVASPKVLGVIWDTTSDTLTLRGFKGEMGNIITKREVLHLVAQVCDPLGWFQPVTIRGCMFFQELWKDKFKWDDPLPADKLETWVDIVAELGKIKTISIPRWFGKEGKQELLCFCDASKRCYATVIYLRTEDSSGKANCKLVFAKGRLAPQKQLSIPRMELMAILIGVRSLQFVKDQIKKPIVDLKLWSDSKCALYWIKSKRENCLFVENRVKEIRNYQGMSFRYVSTKENPADLITRGKRVTELSDIWWHGPFWLKKDQSQWPESDIGTIDKETLQVEKEQKRNSAVMYEAGLVGEEESNGIATVSPFGIDLSRNSDLTKVLCVTAWCQRFVDKTRRLSKDVGNFLTTKEIFAAKQMWEKHVQAKCYHKEMKDIRSARSYGLVQSLGLKLDDKGLIRCYGRLGNSSLEFGCVNPKLLPPNERFTELVVQDFHERVLHSGVLQTLSAVRGELWISKGRAQVKRFIGRCLKCKRYEEGAYQLPQVPSLPRERVTRLAPFKFTGVDYFGPLFIRGTEGVSKIWVCLFTCMAVRAVHLELASDLSAESFLMCLKRFVARRGRPLKIISDNGTQFSATRKMFDSMQSSLSVQGMTWVHIVEWAPWMGGFL